MLRYEQYATHTFLSRLKRNPADGTIDSVVIELDAVAVEGAGLAVRARQGVVGRAATASGEITMSPR